MRSSLLAGATIFLVSACAGIVDNAGMTPGDGGCLGIVENTGMNPGDGGPTQTGGGTSGASTSGTGLTTGATSAGTGGATSSGPSTGAGSGGGGTGGSGGGSGGNGGQSPTDGGMGGGFAGRGGSGLDAGRGGAGGMGGGVVGGVTFTQVNTIVQSRCGGCHSNFTNYNTLMTHAVTQCSGNVLAVANDPVNSAFLELVEGQGCNGYLMPRGCTSTPCIPAADIQKFTAWINAGAPNN